MVFSKIYYSSFAGPRVKAEQSSFLGINPTGEVGDALFVGTCAERAAIGGQVASKLALQHFLSGAEDSLNISSAEQLSIHDSTLAALEVAFKTSNAAVYDFGHKLSAGGRMAASLISIFIRQGFIAAGRVGKGVAYLVRNGEVFPFFSPRDSEHDIGAIGTNSIVSVELASVSAEAGDVVLVFSEPVPQSEEMEIGHIVSLLLPKFDQIDLNNNPSKVVERFDNRGCERLIQQIYGSKQPAFGSILAVGPEVTFLEARLCVA